MISFKKTLYCLYGMLVLSGCRCKEFGPVPPMPPPANAYAYWPVDSNFKWVFKVSKEINFSMVYQFDDTMQFLKDTLILKKSDIYFKEFGFKKLPPDYNFVMGPLPDNWGKLYLALDANLLTAYDMNLMKDNPPAKYIITDGKPIDFRYEMRYTNQFTYENTALGKLKCIATSCTFFEKRNITGYISRNMYFYSADKKGPIIIDYMYKRKNVDFTNDSAVHYRYEIKEILK
jgi:hypothetical protein